MAENEETSSNDETGGETPPEPDSSSTDDVEEAAEPVVETMSRRIGRKSRARDEGERGAWFGLGMFGLVGWSVALPTLAGLALGW
jgi:ATP synthase protein I